jgi:ParB family chromosome partitioning protein
MDYRVEWISPDRVDAGNHFYRITTTHDKQSIDESIKRIGMLCPVVVKEQQGRLQIVSGFRRFASSLRLLFPKVPCRILPQNASTQQSVELAIAENTSQRSLNVVEQARCLHLVEAAGISPLEDRIKLATVLGLSLNRNYATKLKTVLSLSPRILNGMVDEKISLPIALQLAELSADDGEAVAALFTAIPMGLNKQREVLLSLREIAARDDVSISDLLNNDILKDKMVEPVIDGNQKARQIRSLLLKRRYPRLVKAEEQFRQTVRMLSLGHAIQLAPPPHFESTTYTLTVRFDNLDQLRHAQHTIEKAIHHPAIAKLFD